jgi:hypothetical protein
MVMMRWKNQFWSGALTLWLWPLQCMTSAAAEELCGPKNSSSQRIKIRAGKAIKVSQESGMARVRGPRLAVKTVLASPERHGARLAQGSSNAPTADHTLLSRL